MKTSMLEYVKIILLKVSFDKKLYRKEYRKSLSWLSCKEIAELRSWAKSNSKVDNRRPLESEGRPAL